MKLGDLVLYLVLYVAGLIREDVRKRMANSPVAVSRTRPIPAKPTPTERGTGLLDRLLDFILVFIVACAGLAIVSMLRLCVDFVFPDLLSLSAQSMPISPKNCKLTHTP